MSASPRRRPSSSAASSRAWRRREGGLMSTSYLRTVDFRICFVFFVGPRPWHIEIRHRVKKTSTINLFGFETLKLKIRRFKLWKPTVISRIISLMSTSYLRSLPQRMIVSAAAAARQEARPRPSPRNVYVYIYIYIYIAI